MSRICQILITFFLWLCHLIYFIKTLFGVCRTIEKFNDFHHNSREGFSFFSFSFAVNNDPVLSLLSNPINKTHKHNNSKTVCRTSLVDTRSSLWAVSRPPQLFLLESASLRAYEPTGVAHDPAAVLVAALRDRHAPTGRATRPSRASRIFSTRRTVEPVPCANQTKA